MANEIRAKLTDAEVEVLAKAPERGVQSVAWLVSQIVRQWLGDPHRKLSPVLPSLVDQPSELAMEIARRREGIVLRWRRYMRGKSRPKKDDFATAAFIRRLNPSNRVSRGTLYRWARLYDAHGLKGLIDYRVDRLPSPARRPKVAISRPAPTQHVWLSRDEAARRSGLNVGHIRRLCAQKLAAKGLTRKVRTGRSRSTWEIREDARPDFAPPGATGDDSTVLSNGGRLDAREVLVPPGARVNAPPVERGFAADSSALQSPENKR